MPTQAQINSLRKAFSLRLDDITADPDAEVKLVLQEVIASEREAAAKGYTIRPELEKLGISDPDDPDVCLYDDKGEWVATVRDYETANLIRSLILSGQSASPKEEWVKHIVKEGSYEHVTRYDGQGAHCSEPNCEINKPATPLQEARDRGLDRRQYLELRAKYEQVIEMAHFDPSKDSTIRRHDDERRAALAAEGKA
jgi:hypothetical protein